MPYFPVFLSLILTVRNQETTIEARLAEVAAAMSALTTDHELVVVDNASEDQTVAALRRLTEVGGLPNLQVYALTREVDSDTALWVGLENSIGDFVVMFDAGLDDIRFLPEMLDRAVRGADVVFATNDQKPPLSFAYRMFSALFNALYRWFNGVNLSRDAPPYRVLSRRVVNFILQHPMPAVTLRHLPATGGFAKVNLRYSAPPKAMPPERLGKLLSRGLRLLVSTTRGPMRLVTFFSTFGAVANLIYSGYVIAIAIWKEDVAPGWITLSLQQSGMFLLLSLVLLVLGEYILHITRLSTEGPPYYVGQEFTSAVMTRHGKLNVESDAQHVERTEPQRAIEARDDAYHHVSP